MRQIKITFIAFSISCFFLLSCNCPRVVNSKDSRITTNVFVDSNYSKLEELVAQLSNPVLLDTLLERITNQQNVKVLAELQLQKTDFKNLTQTYSGGGYVFKLRTKDQLMAFPENSNDENTVFYDGNRKFALRNYKITCCNDTNYICEDFGFNSYHTFSNPRIIEVCSKKFLYSDLSFACNGMGCGQNLTMIYDIQEKKPTFVANFRLPFNNYLISDFNNDGTPDLLVTAKAEIEGDTIPKFKMKLLVYTYDKGTFKLDKENYFDLCGSGSAYDYNDIDLLSIEKDSWFKNSAK